MTLPRPQLTPSLEIRVALPSDLPEMTRIRTSVRENHASVEELAARGITPASIIAMMATDSRTWLALVDGVPAGFSMGIVHRATIYALFIHPDYEGRGIGKRLLAEAENWLFGQGCEELWLDTGQEPEIRAHGFYLRQGWTLKGLGDPGELRYIKRRPAVAQR
jgi:GNAT superfamily N-acetyltransferase